MSKKKSRGIRRSSVFIFITALVLLAAACSSAPASQEPQIESDLSAGGSNAGSDSGEKTEQNSAGRNKVSLSIFIKSSLPFGTPSMEDNAALKFLEEQIGANLNMEIYEQIYEDKIRVKIASGEIPDVFEWGGVDDFIIPMIESGAIVPFEPYIDEYENLAAQKHLYTTQYQGKIYPIPDVRNPIASPDIPLIRQDWLDHLNLKAPETTDELYDVAVAFTKNDPDNNGKHDTYGIQIAGNNLDGTWGIKMAFGVNKIWMKDGDKVIPYFASEGYKQYLAFMQKLFQAGAIDPDFAVTDHILAQNKVVVEGKAGIFMHYTPRVYEFEDGLKKSNPNAKLVGFKAVKGPNGDRGVRARVNGGGAYLSKAAAEDPEKLKAIMKWLDFGASKEGGIFRDFGVEGIHHTVNNDGTRNTDQKLIEKDSPWALINTAPIQDTNDVYIDKKKSEESQNIVREAHKMNEPYIVFDETKQLFSPTYASVTTEAEQFVLDKEIQAIMGQIKVEDWDAVVQDWYNRFNGEQIVKEIAEAM